MTTRRNPVLASRSKRVRPAGLALTLFLAATGRASSAQEGPWALRIERVEPRALGCVVGVEFTNRSARPAAFCPPLDGSTAGLVQPRYDLVFQRRGRVAPWLPGCGNHGGDDREEALRLVAPGATATLDVPAFPRLTPGAWEVTLRYSIERRDVTLGPRGAHLWFGEVAAPSFTLLVPGPTWDEWLDLPDEVVAAKLVEGLRDSDAGVVGVAADALVALETGGRIGAITAAVRAAMPSAVGTLTSSVAADAIQPFDSERQLGAQLGALLASPSLPEPAAQRERVRRAFLAAQGAGRRALLSLLAARPVPEDLPLFEGALVRPDGDRETFRAALEAYAALRSLDAAIDKAMDVLERTPAGPEFLEYAHALAHVTGEYEPSYIQIGEHGRAFPTAPEEYRQVKRQWSQWWRARRGR